MTYKNPPKIGIKFVENNTSKFRDISEKKGIIFIEFDYIINSTMISKKQLNLYLWRHPEIKTYKYEKTKYVSLDIIGYIVNSKRKKNI